MANFFPAYFYFGTSHNCYQRKTVAIWALQWEVSLSKYGLSIRPPHAPTPTRDEIPFPLTIRLTRRSTDDRRATWRLKKTGPNYGASFQSVLLPCLIVFFCSEVYFFEEFEQRFTMFPTHLSVTDLGVFAVAMVFGLIIVLLFMFDFVSRHWRLTS